MSSQAGDNAAKSCSGRRCRGDLTVTRCRCRVMLTAMQPRHAGDSAAKATWLWRDVDAKSCWRQCYRVTLATTLQLKVVLDVVGLCSPRAWSIEVLSHHEEVGYSCWLVAE
jgi:hypothetical protein